MEREPRLRSDQRGNRSRSSTEQICDRDCGLLAADAWRHSFRLKILCAMTQRRVVRVFEKSIGCCSRAISKISTLAGHGSTSGPARPGTCRRGLFVGPPLSPLVEARVLRSAGQEPGEVGLAHRERKLAQVSGGACWVSRWRSGLSLSVQSAPAGRLHKLLHRTWRHLVALGEAPAQLVGDIHRHVARPFLCGVEGDNAHGVVYWPSLRSRISVSRSVSSSSVSRQARPNLARSHPSPGRRSGPLAAG
jgi:hypothetical protein